MAIASLQPRHALGTGIALCGEGVSHAGQWLRNLGEDLRRHGAVRHGELSTNATFPGGTLPGSPNTALFSPVTLAGWLWGEGLVLPGSVEDSIELVRPFNLRRGNRLLHLGAGLGTLSSAIAHETGCKVTGFERDPDLLAQAETASHHHRRVVLALLGADEPKPSGPRWDHCLARFALHGAPNRRKLLLNTKTALLPGGHISMVEYTAARSTPGLAAWLARQPGHGDIWTVELWRKAFASVGFDLRIEEDVSPRHRAAILSGWHRLMTGGNLAGVPRRQLAPMVQAAERWMTEVMLVQEGTLQIRRFYAT